MTRPSPQQIKLLTLLRELFQLDQPDLDFGLYRIMHARSVEIEHFLNHDLLDKIRERVGGNKKETVMQAKAAYERKKQAVIDDGGDPDASKQVEQALAEYTEAQESQDDDADLYDHLYKFFERYYEGGDFLSRRYYARETSEKAAPYAVPYDGSEVYLHWANKDQYYIKTTENFRQFTVDLAQAKTGESQLFADATPRKLHFAVVAAEEGAHNNVKAANDKERYFILDTDHPLEWLGEELTVRFQYRADPEKTGQAGRWRESRNEKNEQATLTALAHAAKSKDATAPAAQTYHQALATEVPKGKSATQTLLAKYLNQYTAKNSMDYFIHKNLGGFLKRELDFYLKNELFRLDDLGSADAPNPQQYDKLLKKALTLRDVAHKLIAFLAQTEDFQKALWLKKKFVVDTQWLVTLDKVPAALYPQIKANDAQWQEWVKLGFVGEDADRDALLTPESRLVLDTRFFDADFTAQLLASIDNLDEATDGVLVHSENFQALSLMQARYREQVKCIYIDPPYNTGGDGFAYKDNYQHASWLTMISERLAASYSLLAQKSVLFSSIDAVERTHLEKALDGIFGRNNRVEEIIWVQNTTKNQSPTYSTNHEYVEVYSKDINAVKSDFSMFRETKQGFVEIMELVEQLNPNYPPLLEVESALKKLYREHKTEVAAEGEGGIDEWKGIYNYNRAEYRTPTGEYVSESEAGKKGAKIWVWREDNPSMPQVKEDSQKAEFRDPHDSTYRFYKPIHPETKKPCLAPKRGWSWPYLPHGKQKNCFSELAADHRIAWGEDENKIPQTKRFLHEVETNVSKSVINDYTDGEKELVNLFGKNRIFGGPKPTTLVSRFFQQASVSNELVCDFFAGSGTTGEAIVKLNHDDGIGRKYLLIEMGAHFDTVIKPRIQKVVYSKDWKDGKPTAPETGISQLVKVIRLESYEDTLNNLQGADTLPQAVQDHVELREAYFLHYLLQLETQGSPSLLNIAQFADPTAYTLAIKSPGSEAQERRAVDLVESFNWLLGLRVGKLHAPQIFTASFAEEVDTDLPGDAQGRLVLKGKLKVALPSPPAPLPQAGKGNWWFRAVEGMVESPGGHAQRVLVVWRKLTGNLEQDNLVLEAHLREVLKFDVRQPADDALFDVLYVNGSHALPNMPQCEVRQLEEHFHRLMWDVQDV